jgi:methyl-accepting chemotaxis protein
MEEEEEVTTTEDSEPGLSDVLFNTLGIGPILISQLMNGVIREEILRSLIRAGILTTDQVLASLDEAQRRANNLCDGIQSKNLTNEQAREIVQKMRDTAKEIAENTRRRVIEQPSESTQKEGTAEG